jgi:hypothetical protein
VLLSNVQKGTTPRRPDALRLVSTVQVIDAVGDFSGRKQGEDCGAFDARFVDVDISRPGSDLVERMAAVVFLVQLLMPNHHHRGVSLYL